MNEKTPKKARFRVYEIEHQGDQSAAISELSRVGCTDIKVLSRDFDGEESMAVEVTLPEGVNKISELQLEEICL